MSRGEKGTLLCDLSHDTCDVPTPFPCGQNDRETPVKTLPSRNLVNKTSYH